MTRRIVLTVTPEQNDLLSAAASFAGSNSLSQWIVMQATAAAHETLSRRAAYQRSAAAALARTTAEPAPADEWTRDKARQHLLWSRKRQPTDDEVERLYVANLPDNR